VTSPSRQKKTSLDSNDGDLMSAELAMRDRLPSEVADLFSASEYCNQCFY
jgi:hypothetical protein